MSVEPGECGDAEGQAVEFGPDPVGGEGKGRPGPLLPSPHFLSLGRKYWSLWSPGLVTVLTISCLTRYSLL